MHTPYKPKKIKTMQFNTLHFSRFFKRIWKNTFQMLRFSDGDLV